MPGCIVCIRKDYPTTGVLKLITNRLRNTSWNYDQEGLPDYWGIETVLCDVWWIVGKAIIRKDYPTTGVLKLVEFVNAWLYSLNQEGLPDYWGIETHSL